MLEMGNAETVMIRGLMSLTADTNGFDVDRAFYNAIFYAPESAEVKEAKARLMGALKGVEMDGGTRLVMLSALTDLICEAIREGYVRGCKDAFAEMEMAEA